MSFFFMAMWLVECRITALLDSCVYQSVVTTMCTAKCYLNQPIRMQTHKCCLDTRLSAAPVMRGASVQPWTVKLATSCLLCLHPCCTAPVIAANRCPITTVGFSSSRLTLTLDYWLKLRVWDLLVWHTVYVISTPSWVHSSYQKRTHPLLLLLSIPHHLSLLIPHHLSPALPLPAPVNGLINWFPSQQYYHNIIALHTMCLLHNKIRGWYSNEHLVYSN